jgi:hypothetical protein
MQLIWTALPNGLKADGSLRLSVHLSPQLDFPDGRVDGSLSEFGAFLDWPGHLGAVGLDFTVVVNDVAAPVQARRVAEPQPSSTISREIFPPETLVRPRAMPSSPDPRPVSSYSAATVATRVSRGYQRLGRRHPYRPVGDADLGAEFSDLRTALRERGAPPVMAADAGEADLAEAHELLAGQLLGAASFDAQLETLVRVAARHAQTRRSSEPVMLVPPTDQPSSAFAQLAAFHRRRAERPRRETGELPPKDFHQIVSALAEYPVLQRLCGLVFDLELDPGALPVSEFGAVRTLQIVPSLADPPPGLSRTKYLYRADTAAPSLPVPHFVAAPHKADDAAGTAALGLELESLGGLLNLGILRPDAPPNGPRQYSLVQLDLDGAGLKLLSALGHPTAGGAEAGAAEVTTPPEGPADRGAPTLRTSGLSLMREKLGSALAARMNWAAGQYLEQRRGEAPPLYAEDLLRGYRIDIRQVSPASATGDGPSPDELPWRSLHTRIGPLQFLQPSGEIAADVVRAEIAIADEGLIQPAVIEDVSADGTSPLYISEAVFHWQGWSLATPRPANPVESEDDPIRPPTQANLQGLPNATARLSPAAGSLPRLRFGSHYQIRVRTADIAGNGLSMGEADALLAGLAAAGRRQPILPEKPVDFLFRRFDPVSPPVLVLTRDPTEGEAPNVIVLRSTPGQTPAEYAAGLRDIRYRATAERHVVPPKASQLLAEQHGLLDDAFGVGGDPARAYNICLRSGGSLNDAAIVDLSTGERENLPDVAIPDPATGGDIRIENGVRRQLVEGTTSVYPVHYEDALVIPYLPDPAAAGVAIFGLPGINGKSGRLLPAGQIEWLDGDDQELPLEAQEQLGDLLRIGFDGTWPELQTFRLIVADAPGGITSLPEWNPADRTLTVTLPAGESRDIYIASYPDAASLPQFGLYEWWGDGIDPATSDGRFLAGAELGALTMLTPQQKVRLVHASQRPMRLALPAGGGLKPVRFPDQTAVHFAGAFDIHGPSTAKLDLVANWRERRQSDGEVQDLRAHLFELPIYPEGVADTGTGDAPIAVYAKDPSSFRFAAPANPQQAIDRLFPARQDFGDTRHRQVTFQLIATTRYSEHFPAGVTADTANLTRTLDLPESIPSSASPPAPQPGSILPVFEWTEQFSPAQQPTMRRRGGGALRIELGPTWFASGDGEMLGLRDDIEWALDPLQAGPNLSGQTVKTTAARIEVPGEGGVRPYRVLYDRVRGVFFADVSFDIDKTYFPFVRFSMVRYQPNSLKGKCLSPAVDSGLHQLLPERSVHLAYPPSGNPTMGIVQLTLKGAWPGAALSPPPDRGHIVEVVLQQRPTGSFSDPDLGWSAAGVQPVGASPDRAGDILWTGEVSFPASSQVTQHRLLVQEFELYPANDGALGQGWPGETDTRNARRLVYADTILL